MIRRLLVVLVFLFGLAGSSASLVAQAPSAEAFFNDRVLHDLHLYVNSRDLKLLRQNYTTNTYYTADMVWAGTRVRNVAIRSRGSGSRNPWKIGLKVDFNRYVAGRTFVGLNALVLDNLWQDPGLIRDALTMKVFARMGQAVPRESFCRLFINNQYEGLYAMVEPIDAKFLARALGQPDAYLFEYNWVGYFRGEYLGSAFGPWKALFSAQTRDKESDAALYGPIRDLFFEANRPMDAVWRENVERYVDLEQLMTHVAIENFTAEIDGVVGAWGMNNFYLTRPAGSTRHRFLPWDKDNAFMAIDSSITAYLDENVLIRRAMSFPDLSGKYFEVLGATAAAVASNDWLLTEINRLWTLVAPAAYADTKKQYTNASADEQIDFLRAFARMRPSLVLQVLEGNVALQLATRPPSAIGSTRRP